MYTIDARSQAMLPDTRQYYLSSYVDTSWCLSRTESVEELPTTPTAKVTGCKSHDLGSLLGQLLDQEIKG